MVGCQQPRAVQALQQSAPQVQLNHQGQSVPVDVRIFPLRTPRRFLTVDFDQLWLQQSDVLGDDLRGPSRDMTIRPGSRSESAAIALSKWPSDAPFIGLQLLSSDIATNASRRLVLTVAETTETTIFIEPGSIRRLHERTSDIALENQR